MKNKKIIFLMLVILGLLFITSFLVIKEPFTTEEESLREQTNALVTQFNDTLCPAIKITLDNYKIPSDTNTSSSGDMPAPSEESGGPSQAEVDNSLKMMNPPNDEESQIKAIRAFEKDLGSPTFPCPPPEDPVQLPADIDKRILITLKYFDRELPKMKQKLVGALNNCDQKITEGFNNVCPPPTGKTKSPPPPPGQQKGCMNIHDLSPETKMAILRARYNTLSRLLENPEIPGLMARVKTLTDELLEAKKKAENMELTPSCP
jgi:hypothetical protein